MQNQLSHRLWIRGKLADMRVLIVGAGVGGLALAGLLRQRNVEVEVVERSPDLSRAGYMLLLYPLGTRVLHGLGIFEEFKRRSAHFKNYEVHNGHGELLHQFDLSHVADEFGYAGQILRRDLLELLLSTAGAGRVRFGLGLEHLEQTGGKVAVRYSDGSKDVFDAVIGADGVHSKTRRITFGEEPDHETGWGLWVWWTDVHVPRNTIREFWGRGRFVGLYPTPTATGAVAAGPRNLIGPEVIGSDGIAVQHAFADLGGEADRIVSSFPAKTDGLFFWNLADYRSHQWVRGRVALLGDAACSFLPTAGVGASMALESAAVMADELSRCDAAFVPRAFDFYEKRRRHRVEAAQEDSRKLAVWMSAESAALVWTRDQFLRFATPESLVKNIARSLSEPI